MPKMTATSQKLPSVNLRDVRIEDDLVRNNERMLTDGFYAEVTLSYDGIIAQEKGGRPFKVDGLRPIQMSKSDVLDIYAKARNAFTTSEWIDFLLRSIGLEPGAFSERAKRVVLLRMIPFVERNYNLVELGPRGTGKSHLFQQISPYAHLIFRWQGDRGQNVREQCQRPARIGVPVRHRLLRRSIRHLLRSEGRREHHEGLHGRWPV